MTLSLEYCKTVGKPRDLIMDFAWKSSPLRMRWAFLKILNLSLLLHITVVKQTHPWLHITVGSNKRLWPTLGRNHLALLLHHSGTINRIDQLINFELCLWPWCWQTRHVLTKLMTQGVIYSQSLWPIAIAQEKFRVLNTSPASLHQLSA